MDPFGLSGGGAVGRGRRRAIVALFAVVAALRVALLAVTMPIFVNVDEDAHFDTVHKYARGAWPTLGGDRYDREVVEIGARFQSGAWLTPPSEDPRLDVLPGVMLDPRLRARDPAASAIPLDEATRAGIESRLAAQVDALLDRSPNYECFEPPAYGLVASLWLRMLRGFGAQGVAEVMWVRLLGAVFAAFGVLLSYRLARIVVPGAPSVAFCAAALVAVAPQDIVACVSNDAPGIVTGPLVLLVAAFLAARTRSFATACIGGAVLALPMLTKLTTVHASVAALCLLIAVLRIDIRRWFPILLGFAVPLLCWVAYSRIALGMWHGGEHKVALTRLAPQTWSGLWRHPMFRPSGAWMFLSECMTQLWRGDLWFHGRALRFWWSDVVYLLVPPLGLFALLRNRAPELRTTRGTGIGLGAGVILAFATMAALSLSWNFDDALFPTREHPFFTQGRMISACLPALCILVVLGFTRLLGPRGGAVVTALIALLALVTETILNLPIYLSPHSVWRLI